MSKPFFLRRPSGLFCRFLVPVDLRSQIGSRFIVRRLSSSDPNHARLAAALLAIALDKTYELLRRGEVLDLKKILKSADASSVTNWVAERITLPSGVVLEGVTVDGEADQERFNRMLQSLPASANPNNPYPVRQDRSGLLADRIDLFLAERTKGELSKKNLADSEFALRRILLTLCGNKSVNEIDSTDADTVMAALLAWPSNASKKSDFNGLNVPEIIAKARTTDAPLLGPRTIEKYLDRLRSFFTWCDHRGYVTAKNPFSHRRLMTKDKRTQTQKKPFSEQDLKLIFSPDLRKTCDEPHKFWCPLIALFSGARLNEIAQLYIDDLYKIGETWMFKIDADKADKKIKNRASERAVPVHQSLLDLGLLSYIEDVKKFGFERLFPNVTYSAINGYGDAVGDWFNGRYLRPATGKSTAMRAGVSDREKSFHSFRYVVVNRLYSITRERLLVAEITGHDRGNDVLTNVYLDPIDAERRSHTLNQLSFPEISFDRYRPGQFDRIFKRLLLDARRPSRGKITG